MKTYSIILFLIFGIVFFVDAQVILKEKLIAIRLDDITVYEKEGIAFSINKTQKEKGCTIPVHLSIEDSTTVYIIGSTGFAYGRGYLKEDCENGQYCQPILRIQNPISYWNLVVPAYSEKIPKTLYLRLEIRTCETKTQTWKKAITRIPISILVEE